MITFPSRIESFNMKNVSKVASTVALFSMLTSYSKGLGKGFSKY